MLAGVLLPKARSSSLSMCQSDFPNKPTSSAAPSSRAHSDDRQAAAPRGRRGEGRLSKRAREARLMPAPSDENHDD